MALGDHARVLHMLDAAVKAGEFVEGMTRDQFDDSAVETYAVTRLLEIIGEAAKSVSPSLQERYTAVPWRDVARLRDRLAHGYFDVDLDILWEIVIHDMPALVEQLREIVRAERF